MNPRDARKKREAEGVPRPLIKWRRESQSHVLPAIEDSGDQAEEEDGGGGGGGDEGDKPEQSAGGEPGAPSPSQMAPRPAHNGLLNGELKGEGRQQEAGQTAATSTPAPGKSSPLGPSMRSRRRDTTGSGQLSYTI